MSRDVYAGGLLTVRWDDTARTVTTYDETGAVTGTRPYTADERAAADASAAAAAEQAAREAQQATDRAILDATAQLMADAHTDGQPWTQPVGAHDAYPLGAVVTDAGKTWISLITANVWRPGAAGWREVVAEGYPAWVQPTGGHDAYGVGDRISFEGSNWESLIAGNVWSPAAYPQGWRKL